MRNADVNFAQSLDAAVGNDVVGTHVALGHDKSCLELAEHVVVSAVVGRVDNDNVACAERESEVFHAIDECLAPQLKVDRLNVARDEADVLEAALGQVREDLEDGVPVVHVHKVALDHVVESVDDHERHR